MNHFPLLFLGILATLATSFWGLILAPDMRIGRQQQVTNLMTGVLYPALRGGLAQRGADVYRSLGCVECHSQQVRGSGSDVARRWGYRRTVAQDYLGDYPVFLGNQRIGPDLANIGLRKTESSEILRHLYNPQAAVSGSMMPPYAFLFEKRKLKPGQRADASAIVVTEDYQIVPREDATALAAYLLSLRTDSPLFEAPSPKGMGPPAVQSTNAPSNATTNPTAGNPSQAFTGPSNQPGTNVMLTNPSPPYSPPRAGPTK